MDECPPHSPSCSRKSPRSATTLCHPSVAAAVALSSPALPYRMSASSWVFPSLCALLFFCGLCLEEDRPARLFSAAAAAFVLLPLLLLALLLPLLCFVSAPRLLLPAFLPLPCSRAGSIAGGGGGTPRVCAGAFPLLPPTPTPAVVPPASSGGFALPASEPDAISHQATKAGPRAEVWVRLNCAQAVAWR